MECHYTAAQLVYCSHLFAMLSWMATWGSKTAKPSMAFGNASGTQFTKDGWESIKCSCVGILHALETCVLVPLQNNGMSHQCLKGFPLPSPPSAQAVGQRLVQEAPAKRAGQTPQKTGEEEPPSCP